MTRVVAVRHGETAWNREGRAQGWAPVGLTETGRNQASETGRRLSEQYDFERVYSSDLYRARETTELLLDSLGEVPTNFEPAWRERGLGIYQGLTFEEIDSRFAEMGVTVHNSRTVKEAPECGESLRTVQQRVTERFEGIIEGHEETVLIVTHGSPVQILFGHVEGLSLVDSLDRTHLDNCALVEFEGGPEELEVIQKTDVC